MLQRNKTRNSKFEMYTGFDIIIIIRNDGPRSFLYSYNNKTCTNTRNSDRTASISIKLRALPLFQLNSVITAYSNFPRFGMGGRE